MTNTWPTTLVNDLLNRRVVIVIGAGVSKNCLAMDGVTRPPLWEEFLQDGLGRAGNQGTRHIKSAIKSGDFLHACEWLEKKLDDDWTEFLREKFSTPAYQPCDVHEKIFRLDQRVVLSMNIDNIYETYVTSLTGGQTIIKKYFEDDVHKFLRDGSDYVVKVHGTIESPDSIIFTQFDYSKARNEYAAFYSVLDAAVLSSTFVFIGCGVSDPDLNLILENQSFKFPQSLPHYLVTSSKISSDLEASLRRNRNLKCIKYDPKNNHEELVTVLDDLIQLIEEKRSQDK